ncbi:hypothetical protein ABPG73_013252 [Tetrahymena malaccensis]
MIIALNYVYARPYEHPVSFLQSKQFILERSECLINQGGPSSLVNYQAEFSQNLKGLQNNDCIGAKQITCNSSNRIVVSGDNCKTSTNFVVQKSSNTVIQNIYLEINFLVDSNQTFPASSVYSINGQNFPQSGNFSQWCDNTSTLYYHLTEIKTDIGSKSLNIQFQPNSATSYRTYVFGFVLAVQYVCPSNCDKCNDTGCTQCSQSYSLSNGVCSACDSTCQTCSGPGKNQCIICKNNQYISDKNNYCVASCDSDQFLDSSSSQKYCRSCMSKCQTCTNSSSCQQCLTSYYYTGSQCAPCDSTCYSCSGSGKNQCIKCQNNYYISEKLSNYCDANCDLTQGQYIDQSNPNQKYCKKCLSFCKTCTNSTSCQVCMDNYYLNGNTCSSCDSTCFTCSGPGKNQCIKCQNNYYISEKLNNYCDANCDLTQGQYIDQSNPNQKYCKNCLSFCKTCSNSTSCQVCMDNYYLNGNTCSPCDNSCQNCSGPGINQCTICKQTAYFIQPDKNNQCVQSCDLNNAYYVDSQMNPQQKYCRKCLSTCKTCSNGNQCDTCFDKNFLDSNKQYNSQKTQINILFL